ncbi:MAG: hypothetical protein IJZ74_00705 [Clostridia bacterium]|nr:hypothetical protein [Clostridia bacterium]
MALRKMLGSAGHPTVVRLMRQIETQSHHTLIIWAAAYAEEHILPLVADEPRMHQVIASAKAYADGSGTITAVKEAVREARAAAQVLGKAPVRQAAARAIATACAVATTPTNALGFVFYSAAAYAYHIAGTDAAAACHDTLATEELERIYESLQAASDPDENNPVCVNWGC